jgi:prepilin-type N-terminal cleavage/methylation domain-containing protein
MKKSQTQQNKACPNHYAKHCGRGFTLVEVLVAISIFTLSILGLLSVLTSGVAETSTIKQKIIASYLAQEGIEYIRSMRDTYMLYDTTSADNGWTSFKNKFASCAETGRGCYFDEENYGNIGVDLYGNTNNTVTQIPVTQCQSTGPTGCQELLYMSSTGRYGITLSPGIPSGYRRKITLTPAANNPNNEVRITSTVFWKKGSGDQSVTFSENLFKWVQ